MFVVKKFNTFEDATSWLAEQTVIDTADIGMAIINFDNNDHEWKVTLLGE